jgi:hypothetical protein
MVLQARLAELQKQKEPRIPVEEAFIRIQELGNIEPTEMQSILRTLAGKRFGTDGKNPLVIIADSKGLTLRGSPEVVSWSRGMIRQLTGK